ncbi:uncharacterized protein EV154DRAFT_37412 [Mucor mucedo]|uniref:uncharacterized protein n=1 Tax=Mucor mucedo TaxID=29922 RepID=UPI00221FF9C7|nr:uncharacterized protein EV154DRAFT_37412 [Mucor mucedo]KAI7895207.1 hypothetical protein EV154DRAFT_37412 [Mucor mucedo]
MRVLSLIAVATALASSAVSASKNSVLTYSVSCKTTYIVQNGDTCSKIGKNFNISTTSMKKWNPSINSGCTNLYIDQILCLSAPTTQSSAVPIGTTTGKTPTSTKSTAAATTTVLTIAGSQCTKDGDCAGARCCNLANNQCVLDPENNICGILPAPAAPTSSDSTACYPGSYGLGNGDGYKSYCCKTQADCKDDCISGACNGPVNTKTTSVKGTKTSTAKATTTAVTGCIAGSFGLGNGDGYSSYCCKTQADCQDDCINGACNGPVNTKTNAPTKTSAIKTTTAAPVATSAPSGLTVQVSSSKDFCLFLPPSPGNKVNNGGKQDIDAIASSEKFAVAFCTKPNINAQGAGILPAGFITKAVYQTNSAAGFVQVRGTINRNAYELSAKDEGGQYDNHGAGSPPKSACAGYPYYVSLVEPSTNDFCIRCCETYSDCNAGRSAYGCNRVVPAL